MTRIAQNSLLKLKSIGTHPSGLRPLQIWVPDTRRAGFEDEYRREAARLAQADRDDASLGSMMDEALADVDGWE